jgi:phytoene dehydrogenase-like protein
MKIRAAEILLRGRRAAGVRTAEGETLEAPLVIAAVAPAVLAGTLLPEGARAFPEGLPTPSAATLTLYLGVDETALPAELGTHVLVGLNAPVAPGGIETLALSVSAPWDGGRAPQGQRALTVDACVPLIGLEPPVADWMAVADGVLAALDDFMPGLRGRLDFCEVRTPPAWQEITGRPHGAFGYAPESLPVFLGWSGLPHRTPIGGLYVAGDWTFPGSGLADVLEGARRTANLLAADRP